MQLPAPPRAGITALTICAFACFGSAVTSAQDLSALSDYNLIVKGDLQKVTDVEGRTIVGGNVTGQNSMDFGSLTNNSSSSSLPVLGVAGNINSGNPLNALQGGNVEIGGSVLNNRIINFNGGGSLVSTPGLSYAGIFDTLDAASTSIAGMTANSTGMVFANMPGQPGPFVFDAQPVNGTAVFSVDGNALFGNSNNQSISINTNNAADILINVSGQIINYQAGDLIGAFDDESFQSRIVWNFFEATELNFGGKQFGGQILAPLATITTNGVIDGSVYANSINSNSELHLPGYNGSLVVPEPSSALLSLIGATALLLRRKRSA